MTEQEYSEKRARGQAALTLLENETFQTVFDAVRTEVIAEWENTSPTAPSLRDQKHAEVRALKALKTRLQGWVDDAKFAAVTLEKQRR